MPGRGADFGLNRQWQGMDWEEIFAARGNVRSQATGDGDTSLPARLTTDGVRKWRKTLCFGKGVLYFCSAFPFLPGNVIMDGSRGGGKTVTSIENPGISFEGGE